VWELIACASSPRALCDFVCLFLIGVSPSSRTLRRWELSLLDDPLTYLDYIYLLTSFDACHRHHATQLSTTKLFRNALHTTHDTTGVPGGRVFFDDDKTDTISASYTASQLAARRRCITNVCPPTTARTNPASPPRTKSILPTWKQGTSYPTNGGGAGMELFQEYDSTAERQARRVASWWKGSKRFEDSHRHWYVQFPQLG
jgi:hypothetical protein